MTENPFGVVPPPRDMDGWCSACGTYGEHRDDCSGVVPPPEIPQGKIDAVLADPRVEYDQDDWVCVAYDDLYDLRSENTVLREALTALADASQAMSDSGTARNAPALNRELRAATAVARALLVEGSP